MIKLAIKRINNYNYELESNNKIYKTNLEFYNLDFIPKEDHIIYMEESLLKEITNSVANFEILENKDNNIKKEEIIVIVSDNKKTYLKRIYG